MKAIVLGVIQRKKEETGKESTILHLGNIEMSRYDKTADFVSGTRVKEVYVGWKVDCKVKDEVDVVYEEGFNHTATITDVQVLKHG